MPEGGATLLSDLARDALAVLCDRCGRRGRYSVAGLFERHGDIGLPDLLAVLARDCPKRIPNLFDDTCAARYDFRALSRSRLLLVNCLERPIPDDTAELLKKSPILGECDNARPAANAR
jgi:hypothetical protein